MHTSQFQIINQQLSGFFRSLYRDTRGNAMMIMAASIAVLIAFAGCAIDGARIYLVNTRLQQACDAGVLAGRKTMVNTTLNNTTLDATATAAANTFFANNFRAGWFGTTNVVFTPSETTVAQVSGVATATVPMTIMKFWGVANYNVSVKCQAQFDVADTDIMFVLDTTGSMACLPTDPLPCSPTPAVGTFTRPADGAASGNDSVPGYPGSTAYYTTEKSGSRMAALRTAILSFYDTLASSASTSTHIRYGFVTYTTTVNAGKALQEVMPGALTGTSASGQTNWNYQSRTQIGTSWGTPIWQYQQVSQNVSGYIGSSGADDPSKTGTQISTWTGCVEAPGTSAGVTSFNQSSLPNDLNPDSIPTTDITTQWKPAWQDVIYLRNWSGGLPAASTATATSTGDAQNNDPALMGAYPNYTGNTLPQYGWVSCGKPVSRLQVMTRTQVSNYVNAVDFTPMGGTYHDVGMIWGTRMIAPQGIFAADTAAWPNRQAPNRVIVFMTDGVMAPAYYLYGMYGIELYDQRISGTTPSSTEENTPTNLTAFHNARFLAECAAAKARNISVYTVTIASTVNPNMTACASTPSQALTTSTGTGLSAAFVAIAQQVALLRLSQ